MTRLQSPAFLAQRAQGPGESREKHPRGTKSSGTLEPARDCEEACGRVWWVKYNVHPAPIVVFEMVLVRNKAR